MMRNRTKEETSKVEMKVLLLVVGFVALLILLVLSH